MDRLGDSRLVVLALLLGHMVRALEVPLDLPQPPTITRQSPKDYIIDPRDNIVVHCEAKGKPPPRFSWTRNGTHFDVDGDARVKMRPRSGTLVMDISGGEGADAYQGVYQCTAHNQLGTALSHNIIIRQSKSPLWSKENMTPVVAQQGQSLILQCRPPAGLPPPVVFWMDSNFQRLSQSARVSQGLNGDLFFSNVLLDDSRSDYICYARFPHTQTIQQKQPIALRVLSSDSINDTAAALLNDTDLSSDERAPLFLTPRGSGSVLLALRGGVLLMECIAGGLPTPEISWRKLNGDLPPDRVSALNFHKTLRIRDVSESDAGDYRCSATNARGSAHHTIRVTVRAAPYWISAPRNLILAPLETGVLTCRAGGDPKPTISWFINGVPIQSAPDDPSRTVEDDTIIFSQVQTSSSAVYQCNVSNTYGYLLSNALVNVLAEPPRVLTSPNTVYQVLLNRPALLQCHAFGSPVPSVTWFKDSRSSTLSGDPFIFHKNGTLEIPVCQGRNSGKYTCVARNPLGISENHVYLEVKEPTRILRPPQYRVVQKNRDVQFECRVKHDSSLELAVMWLKDGGELPDDDRFRVTSDSLAIRDVTESDAATYTCVVNTTLDQDSASAQLTVVEQPAPPTDLELTDPGARSVQLTWTPGDEHNSPVKKFLVQYEDGLHQGGVWHNLTEVPGVKTTAHLKLSPYVHYSFRVLALNHVGYSRPSVPSRQYRTKPAAPDENPSDVRGQGTEPSNLVISWKPLTALQSNAPGLQYRVMWRQQHMEHKWTSVSVANVSKFVVSGTPTFVPYELMVQAMNDFGHGPKPALVIGHTGEDFPLASPGDVQVMVVNSSLTEVHWGEVAVKAVRGRLLGYKVRYWHERSLHRHEHHHTHVRTETFGPGETSCRLHHLHPHSLYSLQVMAFNGRGEGPASATQRFQTPEDVPGVPAFLRVSGTDLDSLTLEWAPPRETNGHLTGYTLKYHTVNASEQVLASEELELPSNHSSVTLHNLKHHTRYKFYFNAKTLTGEGPAVVEEAFTIRDQGASAHSSILPPISPHGPENMEVWNPQLDVATQGWFIGLMSAVALLILILLIICFIKRNKGGKYPVKEKEEVYGDPEVQPVKEDDVTFVEYSDDDQKPLGDQTFSTIRRLDSEDSLVHYTDSGDTQFNEDGSFIGQYSGTPPPPPLGINTLV